MAPLMALLSQEKSPPVGASPPVGKPSKLDHHWEPLRPENYKQRKRRYLYARCGIVGTESDIRMKLAKACDPYRWQRMADKLKRRETTFGE